jgi:hypothetical protein
MHAPCGDCSITQARSSSRLASPPGAGASGEVSVAWLLATSVDARGPLLGQLESVAATPTEGCVGRGQP